MKINLNNKGTISTLLIATVCLLVLMVVFYGPTDNWAWDPSFYYAQLKSPIIDRDLNFFNDTVTGDVDTTPTVTGLQPSTYPLGVAIVWSPFFLIAHTIISILSPENANGIYTPYIALVSIGTLFYGLLAIYVVYKTLNRFTDRFTSILVCILCVAATPFFFYTFRQPISAHVTTLLFTALIIWVFLLLEDGSFKTEYSGLLFGVLLGLAFINRWTALLTGVFPLLYYLSAIYQTYKNGGWIATRKVLIQILIFAVTFLVTISPQIILWYKLHNRILIVPQSPTSWITDLREYHLRDIIISDNRGLLTWVPFIFAGFAGILWIKNPRLRLGAIINIALLLIVLSVREDWFGGGLFGTRFFLEVLPIIAIGFVSLLSWIKIRPVLKRWLLAIFTLLAVTQQFVLMHAVEFGIEPGWVNLKRYLEGSSLGLRFQWESFRRLVGNPVLWFYPRPYVGQDRQTILVNLLAGVRGSQNYALQLISICLVPIVTFTAGVSTRVIKKDHVVYIALVILGYLVVWSIYLLVI